MNFSKPKNIFYILLLIILFPIIYVIIVSALGNVEVETYGVNKTIGWAWDLCNLVPLIFGISFIISFVGYGILALVKARINRVITILQITSVLVAFILLFLGPSINFCISGVIALILSVILLFMNLGFSIAYKLYDKNKRLDN